MCATAKVVAKGVWWELPSPFAARPALPCQDRLALGVRTCRGPQRGAAGPLEPREVPVSPLLGQRGLNARTPARACPSQRHQATTGLVSEAAAPGWQGWPSLDTLSPSTCVLPPREPNRGSDTDIRPGPWEAETSRYGAGNPPPLDAGVLLPHRGLGPSRAVQGICFRDAVGFGFSVWVELSVGRRMKVQAQNQGRDSWGAAVRAPRVATHTGLLIC